MSSVEAYSNIPPLSDYDAIAALDQIALEVIPAAVCVCSADGTLVRFNRRATDLWGRTPRSGETHERFYSAPRFSQLDGTLLLNAGTPMEIALRTGEPQRDQELEIERPDGSRVVVLMNVDVLKSDSGGIRGAISCFHDITARKHAEQALRQSEQISRQVLDALPAAIYTTDAEGTITYFNPAAMELAGNAPVLGKDKWCVSWRLRRPDGSVLPHDECPMAVTLKEQRPVRDVEAFAERPDGTLIPFIPYPTPMFDASGALTGAVNMLVDASERKQAAEREFEHRRDAERAAQRLASIVESSEDAIVSKDLDGVIVTWNKGAERLFGYTAGEVVGKSVTILIPDDHLGEEPNILGRIRSGERVEHYETKRRHKDGSLIDISLTVSPIRDSDGRIVGASKIARDVTARKRAERALAKHTTEQAALYEFTERLHRARSVDDVYQAALHAIVQAIGCSRASILLLDEANVMRFVAWRGLSDGYRKAVDGHSPWAADTRDPQAICVGDIATADMPDALKAIVTAEGIGALAFIPLVAGGRLVGKFMTYYETPHVFDEAEGRLALAIARQLGFSVDRMRVEEALRESEQRLQMALTAGRMGAWQWNITSGKVIWSPGLEELHGLRPGTFGGTFADFKRDMHPDDVPRAEARIRQALETRQDYHLAYRIKLPDGTLRWLESFGRFAPETNGAASQQLAGVCMDISDRKQGEAQRDLLVAELSHRVKNTLATVISIARQSFATNPDAVEAQRSFNARIRALGQTHSRLAEANWTGVSLEAVLLDELAPYRHEDGANLRISGPVTMLNAKHALTLGMAMHELATNAAKYGALSTEHGVVDISWEMDGEQLRLTWTESGGPPVTEPTRKGFGRLLIERVLASDLDGDVRLDFAREGLRCAITLPISMHLPATEAPSLIMLHR